MTKKYINILFTESDLVLLRETAENHFTTISGLIRGVALDYARRSNTMSGFRPTPAYTPAPSAQEDETPAPRAKPTQPPTPEQRAQAAAAWGYEAE